LAKGGSERIRLGGPAFRKSVAERMYGHAYVGV